jgi:hypothetical protein
MGLSRRARSHSLEIIQHCRQRQQRAHRLQARKTAPSTDGSRLTRPRHAKQTNRRRDTYLIIPESRTATPSSWRVLRSARRPGPRYRTLALRVRACLAGRFGESIRGAHIRRGLQDTSRSRRWYAAPFPPFLPPTQFGGHGANALSLADEHHGSQHLPRQVIRQQTTNGRRCSPTASTRGDRSYAPSEFVQPVSQGASYASRAYDGECG